MTKLLEPHKIWGSGNYIWARDYWDKATSVFWLHTEVPLQGDIQNWKLDLSDTDKHVIGSILKTFTQIEQPIGEYWSEKVTNWFPHPEIMMVALTNGFFETIHIRAYAYLNEILGLESEFEGFISIPEFKKKIDRLEEFHSYDFSQEFKDDLNPIREKALSLAIFSGFGEGVQLFSSFAILGSFKMRGLLRGVGNIIEWSVRDEVLHADFGCKLFNQLKDEYPQIWTDEFKKHIYNAARETIALEDQCIDLIFSKGDLPNISGYDVKQYIRFRANEQLKELGLKSNWKNIDRDSLERLSWFNELVIGSKQSDFFGGRETGYKKWNFNEEDMWEGYERDFGV